MGELRLEAARVNLETGAVHRGTQTTTLTPSAHHLLSYLAARPMETLSREQLLVAVWNYDSTTQTRTVDTTISRLRALLEQDPAQPRHLITVYGAGYRFVPWADAPPEAAAMVLGDCTVALGRLQATWADGRTFPLTAQEAGLLRELLAARGQPVSRSALLRRVWQARTSRSTRSVDNAVMRLRAKIEATPAKPQFLKTVRGAGYLLLAHAAAAPAPEAAPAPRAALLGRDSALAQLRARLADPGLVTLLGTGGVGKTSLARAVSAEQRSAFFCDLSQATDLASLLRGTASGLSIAALPPTADAQIAEIGRQLSLLGPALVVLDNLEQLIEPAQAALPRWLAQAPALRVLVTSRRPVQVSGERVLPLEPLQAPDAEALFRTRYTAAGGKLDGSPDEAKSITALVTQLDGLPLAIELAAARGRLLRPAGLLSRMDQRLRLLRSRGEGRHATLEATIAWSWDLLDEHEQHALAWCSVFHGFSLEAAEELFSGDADALDTIEQLLDHSLLRTEPVAALPGEVRFRMLDSIRAFADKKLSPAQRAAAQAAHAAYYASLAEGLLEEAVIPGEAETFRRLRLEIPNLIAAAENSLGPAPTQAAWCTEAISEHVRTSDRDLLQRLLGALDGRTTPALQRRLDRRRTILLLNEHKPHEARAILEATASGAPKTISTAQLLGSLGTACDLCRDLPASLEAYRRGIAYATELGADGLAAMLTVYEGTVLRIGGEHDAAEARFQRAVTQLGTRGFLRERGFVLAQVGQMALQRENYGYGIHCLRQAVAAMHEYGAHGDRCLFQAGLIIGLWMDGQPDAAEELFQDLQPLPERHLTQLRRTFVLLLLGEYLLLTGRPRRAGALLRQSMEYMPNALSVPMMWLSVCDAFARRASEARELFARGAAMPKRFPYDQPIYIDALDAWREVVLAESPEALDRGRAVLAAGRASPQYGLLLDFRAALRGLEEALQAASGPA